MNARQDHPSFADYSFDDCRSSVGILAHDFTPAGERRAILPVMLKRRCANICNRHSGLVDTSIHFRVKAESHT